MAIVETQLNSNTCKVHYSTKAYTFIEVQALYTVQIKHNETELYLTKMGYDHFSGIRTIYVFFYVMLENEILKCLFYIGEGFV